MSVGGKWWRRDLPLRAIGIAAGLIASLAIRHLVGLAHAGPRHEATSVEIGLAAVGFLGFSLGNMLMLLGARIHDEVEIAERWRVRAGARRTVDRLSSAEVLARFDRRRSGLALAGSDAGRGPLHDR